MLLNQFKEYILTHHLFHPKDWLLLAVSGGVDSVVLCELCHQAGYNFVIAHCNFQLRGEESERDEQFVKSLGAKYGVEVLVNRFQTAQYSAEHKKSIQEAARELRYEWFLQICTDGTMAGVTKKKGDQPGGHFLNDLSTPRTFILTAHHANDSVETLLMNFFKGTGIKGLQGIKPKQDLFLHLIRPLLFARKEELLAFAKQHNLSFVDDSSNSADKYTRNYFRNQLLPSLQKVYPEVENNLIDNLNRFRDIEILYLQSIELHKKKLIEKKGNELHIPVLKLLKTEALQTVLYEILKDVGFSPQHSAAAVSLLQGETGKYIQSATHRVIKNRQWLIITPNLTTEAQHILIEASDAGIHFDGGVLHFKKQSALQFQLQTSNSIAQLDAAAIQFPLLLRKWKQGDYFYPLGMKKKKKLSRFFTDQKLSLSQKENSWVLEMNKKITWVVGMRIDDRYKITPSTKDVIVIDYEPK